MNRRSILKLLPVGVLPGCLGRSGRGDDSISNAETESIPSTETESDPRRIDAGLFDEFEKLSKWSTSGGPVTADTERSVSGSQSVHLHARKSDDHVTLSRTFDPPIDISGLGVQLAIQADNDIIPYVMAFDSDGNRIDYRAPVRGGLSFQLFDFGIATVHGDPDLSSVEEIRFRVWAGDEKEVRIWCDQLRFSERPDTGIVLIQFDDGFLTDYTKAFPVLEEHGFTASTFINPYLIGTEGRLSLEDLSELQGADWDICNHTLHHNNLINLSEDEQEEQIVGAKEWLVDHGFEKGSEYFAYPFSSYDRTTLDIVNQHHEAGFAGGYPGYGKVVNPYLIQRIGADAETVTREIDIAAEMNGVTTLMYHELSNEDPEKTSVSDFESTISYLKDHESDGDLTVLSVSEFTSRYLD